MTTPHDKSLKPCPFCGSVEGVYPSYRWPGTGAPYAIDCVGCGMDFTPREGMDAIEAWNRRASLHIPIEAGNGGDGWLPIETAPQDGTNILVAAYYDDKPTVGCAYWPEANEWFWWHDQEYSLSENGFEARFWRPLPSPPSPSSEGGKQP